MPFALAVAGLNPLIAGLIGSYLWIRSDRLASSIFPKVSAVESLGSDNQQRLLLLALSLMGVWFVSGAIPTFVYNISLSMIGLAPARQSVFGPSYLPPTMMATAKANIIAALVRVFVGFSLLLGRERLAKVISAARGKQTVNE